MKKFDSLIFNSTNNLKFICLIPFYIHFFSDVNKIFPIIVCKINLNGTLSSPHLSFVKKMLATFLNNNQS